MSIPAEVILNNDKIKKAIELFLRQEGYHLVSVDNLSEIPRVKTHVIPIRHSGHALHGRPEMTPRTGYNFQDQPMEGQHER